MNTHRPVAAFETGEADAVYRLTEAEVPWGDYGAILVHGMTSHLGRKNGSLQLERTGPFLPPITFPGSGDLLTDSATREALTSAGFVGIEFRQVTKALIVESHWEQWDHNADGPREYPESGEPEDYVLGHEHSQDASDQMGEVWEIVLSAGAAMQRVKVGPADWDVEFRYVPSTWNRADIFSVNQNAYVYISPRAKAWLEMYYQEWITTHAVVTA